MTAYAKSTLAAVSAIPGAFPVDLAGGCFGVALPVDGALLIMARCPDLGAAVDYATWGAWLEDADGERILPADDSVDLGFVRPRDYGTLPVLALSMIAGAK